MTAKNRTYFYHKSDILMKNDDYLAVFKKMEFPLD
jgi:hypothetical protein